MIARRIPFTVRRLLTAPNNTHKSNLHVAASVSTHFSVQNNGINRPNEKPCRRLKSTSFAASQYEEHLSDIDAFPSIVIGSKGRIEPQGSFAEAQAEFLSPDPTTVESLSSKLLTAKMGVVAHYYMDVELQGILQGISHHQKSTIDTPFISIADSLAMGDHAVKMAEAGAESIACLGVDFMAESVSAILSRNGWGHVPVYRATSRAIGCSLAESAEREGYRAWLEKARRTSEKALHVVYINTSLETKAVSASIVPTITCTSSNVLKTILTASAQMGPELKVYYGPDTYMGNNLVSLLNAITQRSEWSDERIAKELHPEHNRKSLALLRDAIDVYPNGNCVVHHMFGASVVDTVKRHYEDAFVTAHLEVPGEMFEIAMEKSLEGRGVVGSTSDILTFISAKVTEAAAESEGGSTRLKFVLGTEAGMVTSIVQSVHTILEKSGNDKVEAEIIFPVASDAVMAVDDDDATNSDLAIVPGVSGGEGCSTAGGCATCPFMKMNDLDALENVVDMVISQGEQDDATLKRHLPPDRLSGKMLGGVNAIDLGTEPILFMRQFMKDSLLPDQLVRKISKV
mmetsp:Transcript_14289/g.18024  ORF Transcript_14289/g.18024 Transcript_14289/m.18024 type:complete len:571 (-) Transcript_14289:45-1757(-)